MARARSVAAKGAGRTPRCAKKTKRPVKRKKARSAPGATDTAATSPDPASPQFDQQLSSHRRRQASVAVILSETFGRFAETNPDLWDRRAYLMLVGLVYERLATNEDELSTEDLVTLSKILAENRRAEAQSRKKNAADDDSQDNSSPSEELPEHFADTVRQVYGTNFQMPDRSATAPVE